MSLVLFETWTVVSHQAALSSSVAVHLAAKHAIETTFRIQFYCWAPFTTSSAAAALLDHLSSLHIYRGSTRVPLTADQYVKISFRQQENAPRDDGWTCSLVSRQWFHHVLQILFLRSVDRRSNVLNPRWILRPGNTAEAEEKKDHECLICKASSIESVCLVCTMWVRHFRCVRDKLQPWSSSQV